jgi:hypothetical protein
MTGELRAGARVRVSAPRSRTSCLAVAPVAVDVSTGVYLGIPRFETTLGAVRMADGTIRRYPLEYLSPRDE